MKVLRQKIFELKKELNRIKKTLVGGRLSRKIFLANSLIALLSIVLYSYYVYTETIRTNKDQLIETAQGYIDTAAELIASDVERVEIQAGKFILSKTFQESTADILKNNPLSLYSSYRKLEKLIVDSEITDETYNIRLYFNKRYPMHNDGARFFYERDILSNLLGDAHHGWVRDELGPSQQVVYAIRGNRNNNNNDVLVVFVLEEKTIDKWMEKLQFYGDEIAFICSESSFALNKTPVGEFQQQILANILEAKAGSGSLNMTIDRKDYYVIYSKKGSSPFYAVAAFPTGNMESRAAKSAGGLFGILIPVMVIVVCVSYFVSIQITKRIKNLANVVESVNDKNFEIQVSDTTNDEIGQLSASFNYMSKKIRKAMEDVKEAENKQAMAELSLLQAQINPHFLYNTLDNISWLAKKRNAPEINYIIKNLSDHLRIGLNMGKETSSLENEINHTTAYFNIQKYRFENRISLYIDIPAQMYSIEINNLTLQPIVENAMMHGILSEENRVGNIYITAEVIDGNAIINIEDDGVGMDEEATRFVNMSIRNSALAAKKEKGFGLYNVHQRIRYRFGNEYGLNIISQKGKGTICVITIPA